MDIRKILTEKFGYESFRPGQEDVIRDVIAVKDTIAILPTGIGKSLCYQLPAFLLSGTVLIISPLVALMEDQVAIIKRNGEKRVVALNSFLSFKDKNRIIENLGAYKFVFISPEMLVQEHIMLKLKSINLSLIVIDEAHCISQWGFDFRPDYLRIGEFLKQVNRPNILALTATAGKKVIEDVIHYLQLDEPVIHRRSVDRPNITFSINKMNSHQEKTTWIKNQLQETTGPGIIYVSSRKRADELSSYLLNEGFSIASYHAGMEQVDRAFIQEQFISGEIHWICATNAFGMGIHKNNIRQVIHEHLPSTIAGYMQEVGRAGRDGEQSVATLLYLPEDVGRTRFIIQGDMPNQEEVRHYNELITNKIPSDEAALIVGISETAKRILDYYLERMKLEETIDYLEEIVQEKEMQLQQIVQIMQSNKCIREAILSHFGEEIIKKSQNSCCSVCGLSLNDRLLNTDLQYTIRKPMLWKDRLLALLG